MNWYTLTLSIPYPTMEQFYIWLMLGAVSTVVMYVVSRICQPTHHNNMTNRERRKLLNVYAIIIWTFPLPLFGIYMAYAKREKK